MVIMTSRGIEVPPSIDFYKKRLEEYQKQKQEKVTYIFTDREISRLIAKIQEMQEDEKRYQDFRAILNRECLTVISNNNSTLKPKN